MDGRNLSCETAGGTLAWINAIAGFLRSYRWLADAHLVSFFKDRLWEEMDREWLDCLRDEPVENLLRIPSGFVKDDWPLSLQEFVTTAGSLSLPREKKSWKTLSPTFDVHSLGGVLSQGMNMKKKHEALCKHYPEIAERSPSIGRQGKALRRQQLRKALQSQLLLKDKGPDDASEVAYSNKTKDFEFPNMQEAEELYEQVHTNELKGRCKQSTHESLKLMNTPGSKHPIAGDDRYALFEEFCKSGLHRLGLGSTDFIDLHSVWKEALPSFKLIGPYWSLRAALGPLVETLILLDRLLFLQEQGCSVKAMLFPLFDPVLSPRNMAIIALKDNSEGRWDLPN